MAARQLAAVTVPEAGVAPNLAAAAWKESVKGERRGLLELIAGPRADFMRCALPRIKSTQTPSPSLGFRLRHFVTGGHLRRQ